MCLIQKASFPLCLKFESTLVHIENTLLSMAGGTEAFAPVFGQGRTPAAAHSSAKGLSSCRQAPGRVITPLSGLCMVATDPTTDLKVCIFLLECNQAHDKYIEALLSIL